MRRRLRRLRLRQLLAALGLAAVLAGCGCPDGYTYDGTGQDASECERDANNDGVGDDDQ